MAIAELQSPGSERAGKLTWRRISPIQPDTLGPGRPPGTSIERQQMSQIFDFLVCPRPLIEQWADALSRQDEDVQHAAEAKMSRVVTLRNLGQDEFNILAYCILGNEPDVANAVCDVDLVRALSEEEGPWIMAFRSPAIEAIAGMAVDASVLQRWAKSVAEFYESELEDCSQILTAESAALLKDACQCALTNELRVYTCFYG